MLSVFQQYKWDERTKALILSSFFWGYVVTQVPAGQIAQRWGAKQLLLWSMILCSALTLLTPMCAEIGGWKVELSSVDPLHPTRTKIHGNYYFSVGVRIAFDRRLVSGRDLPIDTHVAIQMGSCIGACSTRYILLFGLTIRHRGHVVNQRYSGLHTGLAEHLLYLRLCGWPLVHFVGILRKQFTS